MVLTESASPSMSLSLPSTLPVSTTSSSVLKRSSVATGASLIAMISTVVIPLACKGPPLPCDPLLLSLNVHTRSTLAGGNSLALLYCNDRIIWLTLLFVTPVSNVNAICPAELEKVPTLILSRKRSVAPKLNAPPGLYTSLLLAPPLR